MDNGQLIIDNLDFLYFHAFKILAAIQLSIIHYQLSIE